MGKKNVRTHEHNRSEITRNEINGRNSSEYITLKQATT